MIFYRLLSVEDYSALYDLWIRTPGMGLNTTDDSVDGIAKYLKRNPSTCFAAMDGEMLVGAILAGHDGRRGYISHTAVRQEYRRMGIGRELVNCAMNALEQEGIHKAALVVFSRNESGNAFWESMGFTERTDLTYRNRSIHEMVRIDT